MMGPSNTSVVLGAVATGTALVLKAIVTSLIISKVPSPPTGMAHPVSLMAEVTAEVMEVDMVTVEVMDMVEVMVEGMVMMITTVEGMVMMITTAEDMVMMIITVEDMDMAVDTARGKAKVEVTSASSRVKDMAKVVEDMEAEEERGTGKDTEKAMEVATSRKARVMAEVTNTSNMGKDMVVEATTSTSISVKVMDMTHMTCTTTHTTKPSTLQTSGTP